ncbi:hypothetical protein A3SI_14941 [Nitritalea halalkaliphila LW7]|uniref:Uncharacterized protein n=1 Tax=Nitritalea halalkaliphila LW7 TaxID=1189621 RepID=I5BZ40_9BACT|nr:hypothetical protein [Nitritalea halalkaliphila]EIM74842.1 hypothetical protein A3SI_14941 [Nitritalea halalkaliphila LW7]
MKGIFLAGILCLLLVDTKAYGQQADILDVELGYQFINSTLVKGTTKFDLSDQARFGMGQDDMNYVLEDTLFTDEDKDYILRQLAALEDFTWKAGKIAGANVLSRQMIDEEFKEGDFWEKFNAKYGNCITSWSFPIFTKSREYVISYNWTQCGYLSGSGSVDLYKFELGKWIFVKSYMQGVS